MNYVDYKYTMMVGSRLDKFEQQKPDVYNCRCPFCGDSQKQRNRARGYILGDGKGARFYCHNCGVSFSFGTFLKEFAPDLYTAYRVETLGNVFKVPSAQKEASIEAKIKKIQTSMEDPLVHCSKLTDRTQNRSVIKYAHSRCLPERMFEDLYGVSDVNLVTKRIPKYKEQDFPELPALVIPFFKSDGAYDFIQCRISEPCEKEFRFVTLQVHEGPKVWGQKYLNWQDTIYIFEGPIDAMFIKNAIALAGAASGLDFMIETARAKGIPMSNLCMAFDNDYKYNPQIMKLLRRSIDKGFSVVLFDNNFDGFKDVNDAVQKGGWSHEEVDAYVRSRTFHGIRAQLELTAITKRW